MTIESLTIDYSHFDHAGCSFPEFKAGVLIPQPGNAKELRPAIGCRILHNFNFAHFTCQWNVSILDEEQEEMT